MSEWWKRSKGAVIALLIIGLVVCLFLATGFTRAIYESTSGDMSGDTSLNAFISNAGDIAGNFKTSFASDNVGTFLVCFKNVGIAWLILMVIMLIKLSNKKEYENIEYGSADWCKDSEAFKILSPKEGMILGEKKYLPVVPTPPPGKNGNILVIGGSGSGKSALLDLVGENLFKLMIDIIEILLEIQCLWRLQVL